MELAALKELLVLLREHGVTSYQSGDVKLELGGGISVVHHGNDEVTTVPAKPVDPKLMQRFNSLPPAYQAAFRLGD